MASSPKIIADEDPNHMTLNSVFFSKQNMNLTHENTPNQAQLLQLAQLAAKGIDPNF